jgi:hypothetical protein
VQREDCRERLTDERSMERKDSMKCPACGSKTKPAPDVGGFQCVNDACGHIVFDAPTLAPVPITSEAEIRAREKLRRDSLDVLASLGEAAAGASVMGEHLLREQYTAAIAEANATFVLWRAEAVGN